MDNDYFNSVMKAVLQNPYSARGTLWLRGNLHCHSTRSDGTRDPQTVIHEYASLGYDFLMLSDHDIKSEYAGLDPAGMILFPGNEITSMGPHLLHVNALTLVPPFEDRQECLDHVNREGGFVICNHPNWEREFDHIPLDKLMRWQGYTGLEIINGSGFLNNGSGYALNKWDFLLSRDKQVWGFGNDCTL